MSAPPIDPELAGLFGAERDFEESPPPDVRARVLAGVRARLDTPDGGPDDGGSGGKPGGGGAPGSSAGGVIPLSRAALGMLATFVVGGLVGAGAMRSSAPPAPAPVERAAVASLQNTAPIATPPAPPAGEVWEIPSAPVRRAPTASAAAAAAVDEMARGMAAERALLDAARVALANGEPEKAIAVVERHRKEYPSGQLAEEREAIAIRALAKAGRGGEAKARGELFMKTYPRSLAMPAVSAALGSLP